MYVTRGNNLKKNSFKYEITVIKKVVLNIITKAAYMYMYCSHEIFEIVCDLSKYLTNFK